MNIVDSAGANRPSPRHSRWPYWVFSLVGGLSYATYCLWFMLEAWGRRGEPKPDWFDAAFVLAFPGMFLVPVPFLGPLVLGALAGGAAVWLVQRLVRPVSPPPDQRLADQ